jgi:hypothetical protein
VRTFSRGHHGSTASFSCSGSTVAQATVSRYLPSPGRRPTQWWRIFLRNQAIAFGHHQYPGEHSDTEYLSLRVCSYWRSLMRSVAQFARFSAGFCHWHAPQTLTPTTRRVRGGLPSDPLCDREGPCKFDRHVNARTGLAHALIGSVAERVVQHAACPILLIRVA